MSEFLRVFFDRVALVILSVHGWISGYWDYAVEFAHADLSKAEQV
ncbi:MAG: hypothetical protein WCJ29_01965 [bacterium]